MIRKRSPLSRPFGVVERATGGVETITRQLFSQKVNQRVVDRATDFQYMEVYPSG